MRSLSPIDYATIGESVRKTGRVVIVEEGPKTGGVGAEIAAGLGERVPGLAVTRVASADVPVPFTPVLENAYRPDVARIVAAASALCRNGRSCLPMTERCIIAFDAGGSAIKAALYDERGLERAAAAVGMPPLHPRPGFLERDPEAMWARSATSHARSSPTLRSIRPRSPRSA